MEGKNEKGGTLHSFSVMRRNEPGQRAISKTSTLEPGVVRVARPGERQIDEEDLPFRKISQVSGSSSIAPADIGESANSIDAAHEITNQGDCVFDKYPRGFKEVEIEGDINGNIQECSRGGSGTSNVSSIPVIALETMPSAISADSSFENCRPDDNNDDVSLEPMSIGGYPQRSAERLWNEQVIRETMVEPPSIQERIIGVFSGKKREIRRMEQREIAEALEDNGENDIVMFQARASFRSEEFDGPGCVPVVDFDMIQEEGTGEQKDSQSEVPIKLSELEVSRRNRPQSLLENINKSVKELDANANGNDENCRSRSLRGALPFSLWGKRQVDFERFGGQSTAEEDVLSASLTSPCSASGCKTSFSASRDGYEEFVQDSEEHTSPRSQAVPGHGSVSFSRGDSGLDF